MKFQKFHLNRINYLILILLSIVFLPSVKAIVSPTSNFYVNDYANILSSETEQYIMDRSVALNNVDGTQIVVVTVKNLEGMSIEDYSLKVARSFGIGSAEKDNGLLILLALEEREIRTEIGTGLEGIIPDGKSGRFQDEYMVPYLKDNNWDEGIKNGYDAYYKEIVTLNNLNIDYNDPTSSNNIISTEEFDLVVFFLLIFIGIIFGGIIRSLDVEKRTKWTWVYIIIWGIVTLILFLIFHKILNELKYNILLFLCARFGVIGSSYSSGSSSRGGSFRSGSSFRGGGGSFRGGGSSRRF